MERSIARRSLQDEGFRRRLLEDPKGTTEQELGTPLPEGVEVRRVEKKGRGVRAQPQNPEASLRLALSPGMGVPCAMPRASKRLRWFVGSV